MEALRALIYAMAVFVALAVISLMVAGIMRLLYSIVHKGEKRPNPENNSETKIAS
jgi:cell division protein FtsN